MRVELYRLLPYVKKGSVSPVTLIISTVIVDFPDKNKFLSSEETALIKERVERDRGDTTHDQLTFQKALDYACDLKLWSGRHIHYLYPT
jgi:hypothetical protein